MARLCSKALEAGIETAHVQDLIRTPYCARRAPSPFGKLALAVKNIHPGSIRPVERRKPIRFSRKLLTMLKALISSEERIREEQVTDILWLRLKGCSPSVFEITLHRLRQVIGLHEAVQLHEGRITLDPRYCWVDAWAFERSVDWAAASWRKDRGKGRIRSNPTTQKAINLYQGAFLPEMPRSLGPIRSERLRSMFLRCVVKLGIIGKKSRNGKKLRNATREA